MGVSSSPHRCAWDVAACALLFSSLSFIIISRGTSDFKGSVVSRRCLCRLLCLQSPAQTHLQHECYQINWWREWQLAGRNSGNNPVTSIWNSSFTPEYLLMYSEETLKCSIRNGENIATFVLKQERRYKAHLNGRWERKGYTFILFTML